MRVQKRGNQYIIAVNIRKTRPRTTQ